MTTPLSCPVEAPRLRPFGMRFLTAPRDTAAVPDDVVYSVELQIAVTADGNPWSDVGNSDTRTTTNSDGRKGGEDDGTDVW
jgi:putative ATP-grasp target RiPP